MQENANVLLIYGHTHIHADTRAGHCSRGKTSTKKKKQKKAQTESPIHPLQRRGLSFRIGTYVQSCVCVCAAVRELFRSYRLRRAISPRSHYRSPPANGRRRALFLPIFPDDDYGDDFALERALSCAAAYSEIHGSTKRASARVTLPDNTNSAKLKRRLFSLSVSGSLYLRGRAPRVRSRHIYVYRALNRDARLTLRDGLV